MSRRCFIPKQLRLFDVFYSLFPKRILNFREEKSRINILSKNTNTKQALFHSIERQWRTILILVQNHFLKKELVCVR